MRVLSWRCLHLAILLISVRGLSVEHELSDIQFVDSGAIQGLPSPDHTVMAFLGVPYAAPPVGDLRWKSAEPPQAWNGVRRAQQFSLMCMQPFAAPETMSEDCLYLNIWTSARSHHSHLPVMVWIHGGGFFGGSGADLTNQGDILARRHVVVVTINYRLGTFGFFGHRLLSAESPQGISGNYGLLDQIAALKWIQRNIRQFGGDPRNVTIFGESAGGDCVANLMASPVARGFFHKAIAQSGYDMGGVRRLHQMPNTPPSLEEVGDRITHSLGCDSAPDPLACLRALSASLVLQKTGPDQPGMVQLTPALDGVVLPDFPGQIFAQGLQAPVPTIVGVMKNEAIRDPSLQKVNTVAKYRFFLKFCFPKDADAVFNLFPAQNDSEVFAQLEHLMTDIEATGNARNMALKMQKIGAPAFLFQFVRVPPFSQAQGWGAYHSLDVNYLFQKVMSKPDYEDLDFSISTEMQERWVEFARTGSPNLADASAARWDTFEPAHEAYLEIGNTSLSMDHLDSKQLEVLDRVEFGNCSVALALSR